MSANFTSLGVTLQQGPRKGNPVWGTGNHYHAILVSTHQARVSQGQGVDVDWTPDVRPQGSTYTSPPERIPHPLPAIPVPQTGFPYDTTKRQVSPVYRRGRGGCGCGDGALESCLGDRYSCPSVLRVTRVGW